MIKSALLALGASLLSIGAEAASSPAANYPWMVKSQTEMTFDECHGAMRHDSNYWWSKGKCHMKFIRYAAGVALRDTPALEDPTSITKKGEILSAITQFRPQENVYCEHGGYCHSAQDVKLLGSVLTGPYGDGSDDMQAVGTACELVLADRANILKAGATFLLNGCH